MSRVDHLVLNLRNVIQNQGVRLLACTWKVSGLSTVLPKAQNSRLKLEIKTEDVRHTCLNRAVPLPPIQVSLRQCIRARSALASGPVQLYSL